MMSLLEFKKMGQEVFNLSTALALNINQKSLDDFHPIRKMV